MIHEGSPSAVERRKFWPMSRAHGTRRHRRKLPPISVIPTLFTLGNLVAGFAAVFYASRPEGYEGPWGWSGLTMAGTMVFLGMFLDAVDGTVARLTRSISPLGGQLDSFADAVTFGVAPAFMTLRLVDQYLKDTTSQVILGPEADTLLGKIVWAAAAVYVCCAALRLARFNVEVGSDVANEHRVFRGLPSPGAAGCVASLIILHQHLFMVKFALDVPRSFAQWSAIGIPGVMLLCALAMVSSIPYIHFTNRYLGKRQNFGYVARLAVILFLAVWWFQFTLAFVFCFYAVSGPLRVTWIRFKTWRRGPAAPAAPAA